MRSGRHNTTRSNKDECEAGLTSLMRKLRKAQVTRIGPGGVGQGTLKQTPKYRELCTPPLGGDICHEEKESDTDLKGSSRMGFSRSIRCGRKRQRDRLGGGASKTKPESEIFMYSRARYRSAESGWAFGDRRASVKETLVQKVS